MITLKDKEIAKYINLEENRQMTHIELIASENFVSEDVLKATGSVLTNKYAEGYANKRYYDGCEFVDQIEMIAIDRLKKLFGVKFANVQPHSGSQANAAAVAALVRPGGKILGMSLDSGGHLTHGYKITFSGTFFKSSTYEVNDKGLIDYDEVERIAIVEKPDLIICGYSAYSRVIDFKRFRQIADKVGAKLMADIAHIAGLIAVGAHPSPIGHAHVITSTTHKTLRGARGGIIMTDDEELAKKIDRWVFPGMQGGPLMHVIAGKAVAFGEALKPSFKTYINNVVKNTNVFANEFIKMGVEVVSGGTDNHLFTINVKNAYDISGKEASAILAASNITVNKNTVPRDPLGPIVSSGVRLGCAAMTTKGFKQANFKELAKLMDQALRNKVSVKKEIQELIEKAI